jgi:sphingolipid delta-4 desaturase
VKGAETYSYYGILNIFAFNVGYHNEHHDFPNIPGSRLPQLRAMCPEYYDNLPRCESWIGVIYDYITDPKVGAFSRVKRQRMDEKEMEWFKQQQ